MKLVMHPTCVCNVSGRVVVRIVAYWEARAAAAAESGSVVDGEFLAGLRHDDRAHHLRDTALFDLFRLGA
jgi:hypothetical protein